MKWVKGQSGNPKGRAPVLLPELQRNIDLNRNALKTLILQYFNLSEEQIQERQRTSGIPFVEKILAQCLERAANDGDVLKFRMLLEIVFGKLPEDKSEFEVSPDEKSLIMNYRKRLEEKEVVKEIDEREPKPDSPTSS